MNKMNLKNKKKMNKIMNKKMNKKKLKKMKLNKLKNKKKNVIHLMNQLQIIWEKIIMKKNQNLLKNKFLKNI